VYQLFIIFYIYVGPFQRMKYSKYRWNSMPECVPPPDVPGKYERNQQKWEQYQEQRKR